MPPRLLVISEHLYRALLQIYPLDFRQRFAVEMAQVFRCLCDATYRQAGRGGVMRLWLPAVWDGVGAAFYQWRLRLFKGRMERMNLYLVDRGDGVRPLPVVQAGLAALPFLAFGISCMASKLGFFHSYLVGLPVWQILLLQPSLVFYWLILIGLGAGLLAGFPRWAYPYLGWALAFAWWWSDMGFYGHTMDWKIWLPVAGVMLVTLMLRRSLAPLRACFSGMWREWTLLMLGIYILYGEVAMIADENHHPYLLVFIALTALGISAGAWGYFRTASPLRRILALGAGLLVMMILGIISAATWDARAYYGLPPNSKNVSWVGVMVCASFFIFMAGVGLLVHWLRMRSSSLKEN
jgi:hypothetical protein